MFTHLRKTLLIAFLLATTSSAALADNEKQQALDGVGFNAKNVWDQSQDERRPNDPLDYPTRCLEGIKKAKELGATGQDRAYMTGGAKVPNAKKTEEGNYYEYYLLLKDAEPLCTAEYYRSLKEWLVKQSGRALFLIEQYGSKQENDADGAIMAEYAADDCVKALDEVLSKGVAATDSIDMRGTTMTVADVRAKVCERVRELGKGSQNRSKAEADAKLEQFAKPYRAVGIKGKRLELFTKESFQGPGCGGFISDPKKMKKAKVLYQLLEGDDGYGLRKYVFKGDNYSYETFWFNTRGARNAACK